MDLITGSAGIDVLRFRRETIHDVWMDLELSLIAPVLEVAQGRFWDIHNLFMRE